MSVSIVQKSDKRKCALRSHVVVESEVYEKHELQQQINPEYSALPSAFKTFSETQM
jgi:hypothetical protein